ncbi:MAG: 3-deoxy-D-manno-octulosonic-acid transferase [Alphaproteobacteria bacterium]|jgi:3-deoxy-D-manno-octulosonic-acid transferase
MIYFYRLLWLILAPLVDLWFLKRLIQGKEDKTCLKQRMGMSNIARPAGQLVWFHCASVGESLSILPLISKLLNSEQSLNILVTTGTVTSAKLMKQRLPKGAIHQYVPIDFYFSVKSFMTHWQPNLSVFVESELWPELCRQAPNPIIINGRIGDKSAKRYKKLKWATKGLFERFNLALMQTDLDSERLKSFSNIAVETSGNLKFDASIPPFDQNALKEMQNTLKGQKIFIAASTHAGEEQLIAALHLKTKKEIPSLQTIIIPRHPNRGQNIQNELEKNNITSSLRSKNATMSDIYIADTLGEMGLWYQLADVVFIGGSFVPHGGQNPYEPLKCHKVTLCGPHMFNFKLMMKLFKEREIILQALTVEEFEKDLVYFLKNDKQRGVAEKRIAENMHGLGGATDFTAQKIINLLKGYK